ncbi:MAG: hypothetical protein Fur0042_10050 [Cyanophyceae cyanobacterium]
MLLPSVSLGLRRGALAAAIALLTVVQGAPSWATSDDPAPRPQCFDGDAIATDADIRQDDLTAPSLWFTRDLFGRKVVHHWRVYGSDGPRSPQVDVVVNQQMWRTLEYLGQYDFLSEFGRVAHQYGYGVRICNFRGDVLGSHTCTSSGDETDCDLYLPGGVSARSRPELFF